MSKTVRFSNIQFTAIMPSRPDVAVLDFEYYGDPEAVQALQSNGKLWPTGPLNHDSVADLHAAVITYCALHNLSAMTFVATFGFHHIHGTFSYAVGLEVSQRTHWAHQECWRYNGGEDIGYSRIGLQSRTEEGWCKPQGSAEWQRIPDVRR